MALTLPASPYLLSVYSEEAVEYSELDTFLKLNESYDVGVEEDRPAPVVQPVGVPGASMPLQMTPEHLRTKIMASSPSPLRGKGNRIPSNKRVDEFDVSTELSGYGLQGVMVTSDELADLVAELGLEGDEAGDLVKGLSNPAVVEQEEEDASKDTSTDKAIPEASPDNENLDQEVREPEGSEEVNQPPISEPSGAENSSEQDLRDPQIPS